MIQNWIKAHVLAKRTTDLVIAFGDTESNEYAIQLVCQYTPGERADIQSLDAHCQLITYRGMEHLSKTCWINLSKINLGWNKLGNKGFKYLSRANLNMLCKLELQVEANHANSEGLLHLTKASWKQLKQLYIYDNMMGNGCIFNFIKSNWASLELIYLSWNSLTFNEIKYLVLLSSILKQTSINCNLMNNDQMEHLKELLLQKCSSAQVMF